MLKFLKRIFYKPDTEVKVNGKWMDYEEYKTGKITEVRGKWNTQAFCDCGNELVHSNSFVEEYVPKKNRLFVFRYRCSHCRKETFYSPSFGHALVECNADGEPL